MRYTWAEKITSHFDGVTSRQVPVEGFSRTFGHTLLDLTGHLQAKELLNRLAATGLGLPENEVEGCAGLSSNIGRHQTARPNSPNPLRRRVAFSQPVPSQQYVLDPAIPVCIDELAGTVTAAQKVYLHDSKTGGRQGAGAQRHHAPRLVHLLAKGVYRDHDAADRSDRFVVQHKALPDPGFEEEGLQDR